MKAAICKQFNAPLELDEIHISAPTASEVKVRIDAVAICHSDISFIKGYWGGPLPAIYGHEAAGTITEVGDNVTRFKVGGRVIVTLMRSCGVCPACSGNAEALCTSPPKLGEDAIAKTKDGTAVWSAMNTGAFAEEVIIHERQIVDLPDDIPFDIGALIGCGVITGYGAVRHVAQVMPDETAAIVGCGGVGLNAIQAARVSGASIITAIDASPSKAAICKKLGATHFINPHEDEHYQAACTITPHAGYDVVLVAVGSAKVITQSLRLLRAGGRLVVMGLPPSGDISEIEMTNLASLGQSILGTKMGSARIREDIPKLIDLYRNGEWVLDGLISDRFDFKDINTALRAAEQPDSLRIIVQMS